MTIKDYFKYFWVNYKQGICNMNAKSVDTCFLRWSDQNYTQILKNLNLEVLLIFKIEIILIYKYSEKLSINCQPIN